MILSKSSPLWHKFEQLAVLPQGKRHYTLIENQLITAFQQMQRGGEEGGEGVIALTQP